MTQPPEHAPAVSLIERLRARLAEVEAETDRLARVSPTNPHLRYLDGVTDGLQEAITEVEREAAPAPSGADPVTDAHNAAVARRAARGWLA
jgi:hypothetical protein